jgi:aryl-alcohol dehydrogenase-like predicted oxidoreductase
MRKRRNRDRIFIATKVGVEMAPGKKGLSRAYIMEAVEASLRRLQTDYVDLYQSHVDDRDTPMDETLETYSRLVQQGKVRAIGASNFLADRLVKALDISRHYGYPRYETLQPLYNLYDRAEYEDTLAPTCQKHDVRVITYFSLASGFLTGKYRSPEDFRKSQRGMGIPRYLNERGYRILGALDEVAREQHSTPGILALAWLLTRPGVTAFIASATTLEQLADLVTGTTMTLDEESLTKLDQASEWREIQVQTQSA